MNQKTFALAIAAIAAIVAPWTTCAAQEKATPIQVAPDALLHSRVQDANLRAAVPSKVALLEGRLDMLTKRVATLEARLQQQQAALEETNKRVHARPRGYHKAFINIASFGNLPPTDAISYWARD